MKEDRGAVKRDGLIVRLRPAAGAREAFPYTYRHWQGGGMDILIADSGEVVEKGDEDAETVAMLILAESGRTRSWQGRLQLRFVITSSNHSIGLRTVEAGKLCAGKDCLASR